jgi:hypothetical protein
VSLQRYPRMFGGRSRAGLTYLLIAAASVISLFLIR